MNEFSVFFLIVSVFAFNAFCMNPSNFGPPAPPNVEFGECLFVHKITGRVLTPMHYDYRHICREKFPDNKPERPEHEKNWFVVGKLRDSETVPEKSQYDYRPIKQMSIKFALLDDTTTVELKYANKIIEIEFQSIQQRNAFYGMVYKDKNMGEVSSNRIGLLHEIMDQEIIQIGANVEALREKINKNLYITFKNDLGEPLLIVSQTRAGVTQLNHRKNDKQQLLFRAHAKHYILTFSTCTEALQFSDALFQCGVKILQLWHAPDDVRALFEKNQIMMNPINVQ